MTALRNSTASKEFYVYVHRRASDGRVFYVGKGSNNRAYVDVGRTRYWRNIVKKHGLIVEIVESGMQEWWAFEMERELIAYYGRDNLCNLTDGGDGASGAVKSDATRKRISEMKTGKPMPDLMGENAIIHRPGMKERMFASQRGQKRPSISGDKNPSKRPEVRLKQSLAHLGKPKSESHRLALSKANLGKKNPKIEGGKNPVAKAVICLETGVRFECIKHATDWLKSQGFQKASDAPISRACRGMFNTGYGYTWRYA